MTRKIHHWALERMVADCVTKKQIRSALIVIADQYVEGYLSPYLFHSLLQRAAAKTISL